MIEENENNKLDEIINVRLPLKDYELLRSILKREEALSTLRNLLRSWWVWVVGSGVLTFIYVYKELFQKAV